jgi:hypothetical protein
MTHLPNAIPEKISKLKKMNKKTINTLVTLLLLFLTLSGCTKDEDKTTGMLHLSFQNNALTIKVHISAVENTDVILYTFHVDREGKVLEELNAGNYYLTVSAYDNSYNYTHYSNTGFQIRVGHTTSIKWGANNGIAE